MDVTPLAGVWIEILVVLCFSSQTNVTPLAGVWIEILSLGGGRERETRVTPLAGVWIEIFNNTFSRF